MPQHMEKTASQLGDFVRGVRDICDADDDEDWGGRCLRAHIKNLKSPGEAQEKAEKILTDGVSGTGPTGAGIFLRRVQQEEWEEVFPYADERALEAAVRFGVNGEADGADELAEKVDGNRGRLVRLLDALVGIRLQKLIEDALKEAGITK